MKLVIELAGGDDDEVAGEAERLREWWADDWERFLSSRGQYVTISDEGFTFTWRITDLEVAE